MKMVTAFIQPEKLHVVKQKLFERGVFKMSVTSSLGCGQQRGHTETTRGVQTEVTLLKKVRLDIAVDDDVLEATIDAIIEGARTGKVGDGKIFVQELTECIRIGTGERGAKAI